MTPDHKEYRLIATYSAGWTIAQMQRHPCEQELWSQVQRTRAWRKSLGAFSICSLDGPCSTCSCVHACLGGNRPEALQVVPGDRWE